MSVSNSLWYIITSVVDFSYKMRTWKPPPLLISSRFNFFFLALIFFLTYNDIKRLHRILIINLHFHFDYPILSPFYLLFSLLPGILKFNLSGIKSSKAYSSAESVLCSFSFSFSDFSFLRILMTKSFPPWLCTPISCFRWRGSLPA